MHCPSYRFLLYLAALTKPQNPKKFLLSVRFSRSLGIGLAYFWLCDGWIIGLDWTGLDWTRITLDWDGGIGFGLCYCFVLFCFAFVYRKSG